MQFPRVPLGTLVPPEVIDQFDAILRTPIKEPYIVLETLTVAPTKIVPGMLVLADGVEWDPGSGAGIYVYYGSAWVKLG